jgi:TonB family protein
MLVVRRQKITRQDGTNLVFVDKGYSPFSFFNLIFIRKEYYIDGKLTPVVEHEKVHIRQLHTLDLILVELATIIQWFNPFVWLLGRSVKNLHEYLADEGVLKKGFRKSDYQTLILNEAMGLQINNLTNNFNVSLLKNRIKMMTKTRSASWSLIKVMMAIPALLAVLLFFTAGNIHTLTAQDTQDQKLKEEQQRIQKAEQQKTISKNKASGEEVFKVVEVMPEYPGGQAAMIDYLIGNIKYPDEAKKAGVQGTVFVKYIVEKDGSITHTEVIRGIGSGCDEEALRVVSAMPNWSPGKEGGKPVRVEFALPIKFALDDKAGKPEKIKEVLLD